MDQPSNNQSLSDIAAIKRFFEDGKHGRRVSMIEMKALSKEERADLGALCRKELSQAK